MQSNVKTFPAIFAFKAYSGVRQLLKEEDITADTIAEALGVQLNAPLITENNIELEGEENNEFRSVDILGASLYSLTRTRDTVYNDAALSFMHALKTEVFSVKDERQAPNSVQREVFSNWIDLLYWTLPPTWMLHILINDIRNNIDSVMASEDNMLFMVEKHQDVVMGGNLKWSAQCSKSDDRAGYSCGLWSLFHIVSIGVIERHRAVLGARDQVSTKFVAQTVRNYVEQFFDCAVCKEYFLEMFDRCGFSHCRRFKQPQKLPPLESWAEFAIWLWEVHNDVNVKLVEAESQREGGNVGTSKRKSNISVWPPANQCPSCRDDNGNWKKDAVLGHLKKEYWCVVWYLTF
jgi:thiol oxidase